MYPASYLLWCWSCRFFSNFAIICYKNIFICIYSLIFVEVNQSLLSKGSNILKYAHNTQNSFYNFLTGWSFWYCQSAKREMVSPCSFMCWCYYYVKYNFMFLRAILFPFSPQLTSFCPFILSIALFFRAFYIIVILSLWLIYQWKIFLVLPLTTDFSPVPFFFRLQTYITLLYTSS